MSINVNSGCPAWMPDPGSRILDPGSWMPSQKIQKIGKCHEIDKKLMKLDENLPIWSQMGQGNLSRRVPDLKNARGVVKNEGVQVWAPFVCKGGV